MRKLIDRSIDTLLRRWPEPENGVWESVERRLYTYGKVMAWNGLGTAAQLTKKRKAELEQFCEEIRAQVLANGVKMENGARFLAQTYEKQEVDAASLLAFTSDFLPPDLARSTRERIEHDLGEGALVFRNESLRANGEGAFLGNFPQAFSHLGHIGTILNLDLAKEKPQCARLSDQEKFQASVGLTVGWRGVIAGVFRVPRTFVLLFSSRSKWRV